MPKPVAAQLTPDSKARLDSIFADFDRTGGPGCALGVVRDGRLACAKGYGIANLDDRTHVVRNRTVGYAPAEHGFKMIHRWNSEDVGAGGMYASIEDLARWDRNFGTERIGGGGFTDQMTTRGRLANGDTLGYAFGLSVGTYRGQRTVGHKGGSPGFRTQYLRFPETGRSIIVLCNSESADVETRTYSVADIILEDRLASRK